MKVRICGAVIAEVISEEAHHYKIKNPDTGGTTLVQKHICETINEAEEILKGAEKLSAQLNKSEWAKMPKVKEDNMEEKEYVVVKPIMRVPAEEIKVKVNDTSIIFIFPEYSQIKPVIGNPSTIPALISLGIIAEKKSKAKEILDNIKKSYENNFGFRMNLEVQQIILQELEKAGIE